MYLVDYENTNLSGLNGIEQLTSEDKVVIFYSKNAGSISFEGHVRVASAVALVEYIRTEKTGKNYLDFQLATYCGYMIANTEETEYVIVSKDTGFESVIDFWRRKKPSVQIRRTDDLKAVPEAKEQKSKQKQKQKQKPKPKQKPSKIPAVLKKKIRSLVKNEGLKGGEYNQLYASIMNAKSKQSLSQMLYQIFQKEKGSRIYDGVLPVYEEFISGQSEW